MFNHHMPHMFFKDYMLVKKSTVFFAALVAAGLVGCHYAKYNKKQMNEMQEEMEEAVDKGKTVAKKTVEDLKAAK